MIDVVFGAEHIQHKENIQNLENFNFLFLGPTFKLLLYPEAATGGVL